MVWFLIGWVICYDIVEWFVVVDVGGDVMGDWMFFGVVVICGERLIVYVGNGYV